MKLYCTLYRRTSNGLKIVGTDIGRLRITAIGLEVATVYWTSSPNWRRRYRLVHGVSSVQGQEGRLVELGEYFLGGRITIDQPIYLSF